MIGEALKQISEQIQILASAIEKQATLNKRMADEILKQHQSIQLLAMKNRNLKERVEELENASKTN